MKHDLEYEEYIKFSDDYVLKLKDDDEIVDNLDEAIIIAEEYKRTGKYDWFRGQSGIWPLVSSRNRLTDIGIDEAEERLSSLLGWSIENKISDNIDYVESIAQHYKIPTLLIDFTTDPKVAGFFASDKSGYEPNEYSCIYCLNTENFNKKLNSYKKYLKLPENQLPRLLDVDIDNLWRLEAQNGEFMYQPSINLDSLHSLHRIVFKIRKNDVKYFDKAYIYPESKSALEERLDSFFLMEQNNTNAQNTNNFIQELEKNGMTVLKFEAGNELYIKEFIKNEEKLLNYKWSNENLKLWENKNLEKYKDIYTTEKIQFEIKSFKNTEQNKEIVFKQISKLLTSNVGIRRKAIKISVIDNEENTELIQKFEKYSKLIWHGMRKLPYENVEIAKVMSDLIQMIDISIEGYEHYDKDFIKIGFSDVIGSGNVAFVNKNLLFEAMRDDLNDFIIEKTTDVRTIIYHIRSPQLLYKFEKLKRLFVESIIISQVLFGSKVDSNENDEFSEIDFVIFSPVEIMFFGSP